MAKVDVALATAQLDAMAEESIKEILDQKEWMKNPAISFSLITRQKEVEEYIDYLIDLKVCALDLETTGLNTRTDKNGESCSKLVGVCLASSPNQGVYIPVAHADKEYNVPVTSMVRQLKRLTSSCRCIYHNFKYDGQILWNYGIPITDESMLEDTMLMAAVEDASRKEKGLKILSEKLLKRPMLEIDQLGVKTNRKDIVAFDLVPPPKALYYAAPDAMNSYGLYNYFEKSLMEKDPLKKSGLWVIYKVEKRCLFPTMEMERNMVRIDVPYLKEMKEEVEKRIKSTEKAIYEMAKRTFDINSPKQLGELLFGELGCKYPDKQEKTKSGQFSTDGETLEKIKEDYPIVNLIVKYREQVKLLSTYILNFIKNADENSESKFQLNQVRADTGRFSSSGGSGLLVDGYSGVNCQNIPTPDEDDPECINLRRAIVARPGYKIVSVDYSGEELRVAANYSREPKWIKEFNEGSGDLHTMTAQIVNGRKDITKKERKLAKTLNFHILYGGGAMGFAARAKIPIDAAKKIFINYFDGYKVLKKWVNTEIAASKKRGYAKTVFGRRRPLNEYYSSDIKEIRSKGDRCAVNSAIQGCAADIMKIALYRVWKWVHDNNFQDDVRMLMPIHDEIVFEIKEDKMDFYIPEICEQMRVKDIVTKMDWPVSFEVDAEYGDSLSVSNNYWEEQKAKKAENKVSEKINTIQEEKGVSEETGKKSDEALNMEGAVSESRHIHFSVSIRDAITGGKTQTDTSVGFLGNPEVTKDITAVSPILNDPHIKNRIDNEGYLNYPLNIDSITATQLKAVLSILFSLKDDVFIGPKSKIRFLNKDGEIWYTTSEAVSIDAFVALCLWLNI